MKISRHFLTMTAAAAFLSLFTLPSQAATVRFGTSGIIFSEDTRVTFEFTGSNNFYRSRLGVFLTNPTSGYVDRVSRVNLIEETKQSNNPAADAAANGTNGWIGTCGNTVINCTASFVFKANESYTLGLDNFNGSNYGLSPYVYSTTASNRGSQQAVFGTVGSLQVTQDGQLFNNPGNFSGTVDPLFNAVEIFFEDGGFDAGTPNDRDFNDFRILARAEEIPAPGLFGALLMSWLLPTLRRRRQQQAAAALPAEAQS